MIRIMSSTERQRSSGKSKSGSKYVSIELLLVLYPLLADRFSYLFIKGAPDILLPRCSPYFKQDGTIGTLSQAKHDEIEAAKGSLVYARKESHSCSSKINF